MGNNEEREKKNGTWKEVFQSGCNIPKIVFPQYSEINVNLQSVDVIEGVEELNNYDFLPTNCLHEVFLFLEIKDLLNIMSTCQLFKKISNTDFFWKHYYQNFYPNTKAESSSNWKVTFVNQFVNLFNEREKQFEKFFKNVEVLDSYHYLFKIILLGDYGCGKSSLMLRFRENIFPEKHISTIGVDFKVFPSCYSIHPEKHTKNKLEFLRSKIQVWDTSGRERFHSITSSFYKGSSGFIICFDVSEPLKEEEKEEESHYQSGSLNWPMEIRKEFPHSIKFYLDEIKNHFRRNDDENSPFHYQNIILCGTKIDRKEERIVTIPMIREFMKKEHMDFNTQYVECSAKERKNMNLVFGQMLHILMQERREGG